MNNIFCPKSIFDIFTEAELTAAARSLNSGVLASTAQVVETYQNFASELAGMMEKRGRAETDPFTDRMATALVVMNVLDRAVRDKNRGTM